MAFPDAAEDEHVVVHGKVEQDHEQEHREPSGDAARGGLAIPRTL
jgi:hypothetical protein